VRNENLRANLLTYLLTAAQMTAIEQAAIAQGAVTGSALMLRAGRAVVDAVMAQWPELAAAGGQPPDPRDISTRKMGRRALVLCGAGNNGGDGYVVAQMLHAAGWHVDVLAWAGGGAGAGAGIGAGAPDARAQELLWRAMGPVQPLHVAALQRSAGADLCVDALFGTGLSRPVAGELAAILACLAEMALPRLVAVDLPSGLSADRGLALGQVPRAALTVTFDSPKLGHYLAEGPEYCGRLVVADIGLAPYRDAVLRAGPVPAVTLVDALPPDLIRACAKGQGHKYTHGHALVLAGGSGQGGAARLAARAALRVGAGAVTIACPPDAIAENAAQLDAIMLREVADAAALRAVLQDKRINALCLGPGFGLDARAAAMLGLALAATRPGPAQESGPESGPARLVLDADALTLLARDKALFAGLHGQCLLTPHDGEFARLFPDLAEAGLSRVAAVRAAAQRAGCILLRKGPDTVIADPLGGCTLHGAVYARRAPWLATAGAGDVLAGIITGLLARGFAPSQAAVTAAWLHAESALHFGPGLIAEDLPEQLPAIFRKLGL
jgi:hydroxyethylthiazole kinase-like uncharacterized protein yjeF